VAVDAHINKHQQASTTSTSLVRYVVNPVSTDERIQAGLAVAIQGVEPG
jgi:hypothetical protein